MLNGNPCVKGTRTSASNDRLDIGTGTGNISEPYTFFGIMRSTKGSKGTAFSNTTGNVAYMRFHDDNVQVDFGTDNFPQSNIDGSTDCLITLFSATNTGTAVLRHNRTQENTFSRTTSADSDGINDLFALKSSSTAPNVALFFETIIFYESDQTTNFDDIEKELMNPNNI